MRALLGSLLRGSLLVLALVVIVVTMGGGIRYLTTDREEGEALIVDAANLIPSAERSWLSVYLWFQGDAVEAPADPQSRAVIPFHIDPGEAATTIAPRLEREGLISDASVFRNLLKYRGADRSIEAGDYLLRPSMTMDQIIDELQHGRPETAPLTVPEGWRAEQIANEVEQLGVGGADEFLRLVLSGASMDYAFLRDRAPGGSLSLEGYLFPDTYEVPLQAGARTVAEIMLSNFGSKVTPQMRAQIVAQGKSLHEVVILASIVEREAVVPAERPIIASVYLNRLATGMYLQADPTVQYSKGFDPQTGRWWGHMLQEEAYTAVSDYNTFLHPGLPPGPICNPGLASIQAVIEPAQTDFLFFFAKGDGSHAFAVTYEEHLRNQAQYGE